MIVFPNAKINIGLNITEKRTDGYHNLETVFYPINLKDILELIPIDNAQKEVEFSSSGIFIPGDINSNLIVKAYHLIQKDYDIPGLRVHLEKVIPIGAGLGGGSSDAAFFINAVNDFFKLGMNESKKQLYARQLGSDCSFFLNNKPCYAEGKGDELQDFNFSLKGKHLVLVKPPIHINTAQAYAHVVPKKPKHQLLDILKNEPLDKWKNYVVNDFEYSVFIQQPEIKQIKEKLYDFGATYSSMSGSGSSVFGIFDKPISIDQTFQNTFTWQGELE
jgi:4-diphosphocytidyl-2-C-methyl-D-erythritol kinase